MSAEGMAQTKQDQELQDFQKKLEVFISHYWMVITGWTRLVEAGTASDAFGSALSFNLEFTEVLKDEQ